MSCTCVCRVKVQAQLIFTNATTVNTSSAHISIFTRLFNIFLIQTYVFYSPLCVNLCDSCHFSQISSPISAPGAPYSPVLKSIASHLLSVWSRSVWTQLDHSLQMLMRNCIVSYGCQQSFTCCVADTAACKLNTVESCGSPMI